MTSTFPAAASPKRDIPPAELADESTRFGPVFQQFAGGVQFQAAFAEIAEEGWVLVHDPNDAEMLACLAPRQWHPFGLGQRAVGAGNRVAVGVDRGIAQVGVDPVDQPLRGGVFHVLGFFVDLVPRHGERLGQEPFEQPMPADDLHRQPLARVGQSSAFIGRISGEIGLGERFEHARDRPGRDVECLRQLAGSDESAGGIARRSGRSS